MTESEQLGLIPVAAQGGSVVDLGDFGSDFDDWSTSGAVTLQRVERSGPGEIESAATTLRIDSDGELAPTIACEQPIRDANLRRHDALTATVMAGSLEQTDAPVQFRFKLVHNAGHRGRGRPPASRPRTEQGKRAREGRSTGSSRSEGTLTSKTFRAPQGQPIRLSWDLSSIDDTVLDNAVRLELVCERADRPVSDGPYGAGATGVRGPIFVEDVVLTDSTDAITAATLQRHWLKLEATHGSHADTITEFKTESAESGQFIFDDGTQATYDFESQPDGSQVFSLGGQSYHFNDGMAAVEVR